MADEDEAANFITLFGAPPVARGAAPGRVNLIGDHTDYQHGFVLPTVLALRTVAWARPRTDGRVRVASLAMGHTTREYGIGDEAAGGDWLDYVQGVTWALRHSGFEILGADILIQSTVPSGAGVSSSAALEVAILRALVAAFALPLDDFAIARLAHEGENGFVGAGVGIMDQMVCTMGRPGHALFLDTRSLAVEHLPLPDSADIVVLDSGISHRHVGGEYAVRRAESVAAAAALGVTQLRDVDAGALGVLPPLLQRRARHIVTENGRVLEAVSAMRDGDAAALGVLFNASHASLRDDYETSVPMIDRLVSLAQADPDVYGARMTGGGFGGAVVLLARQDRTDRLAERLLAQYEEESGLRGSILAS